MVIVLLHVFFFFNDTATTEIYTLSLHDALPIWTRGGSYWILSFSPDQACCGAGYRTASGLLLGQFGYAFPQQGPLLAKRSEEHTSELQSRQYLVCRLLLEKKKYINA